MKDNRCKGCTTCSGMCRDTWELLEGRDNLRWAKILGITFILWAIILVIPWAIKVFGF